MLVALIVKNELVSLLLTGMCMISAAIILYRNLALLTNETTDDLRIGTLRVTTLINIGFSDSSKNPQYLLQFPPKRLSAVRHPSAAACPKRI